ncbi:MAG: hypothetical protein IPL84_10895 [Chitinophagaceae bacterium]|nr:hypothetical protein [Chitinophagaceae bacterium]
MIKKYLILFLLAAVAFACNNKSKSKPVSDVDVARAFVRDLLDNKFDEAEQYLLKDETNSQIFDRFKKQYSEKDKATLEKYKNADIIVNEISYITDSVCIFNYSNSYSRSDKTILKVVRPGNEWLIDLKYTFSGNL